MSRKSSVPRLHVSRRTFLKIKDGEKTIFVHTDDRFLVRYQVGHQVKVVASDERVVTCEVVASRRYPSLEALLEVEPINAIAIGNDYNTWMLLNKLYPSLPKHHTFVALELRLVPRYS